LAAAVVDNKPASGEAELAAQPLALSVSRSFLKGLANRIHCPRLLDCA
jgi:hypothetical protein